MLRSIPSLILAALLCAGAPAQASLSVASASGQPSPFTLSEILTIQVSGEPLRPLTLLAGPAAAAPLTLPGVEGLFLLDPLAASLFGSWDALGIFGPPTLTGHTDHQGLFSTTFQLPPVPQGILVCGAAFQVQALVAQSPVGGQALELSNAASLGIAEPAPVNLAASPFSVASWTEGTSVALTLSGTFPAEATVLPVVTFQNLVTGAMAPGTVTAVNAATVEVQTPPFLGAPTAPPSHDVGPVLVTVDFETSGIYCAGAGNGVAAAGSTDPNANAFLLIESTVFPALSGLSPRGVSATPNGPLPPPGLIITGSNFLYDSSVLFQPQGTTTVVEQASVTVDPSGTQITLDPPPGLAPGIYDLAVRNPDGHLSPLSPPLSDFVHIPFVPADVTVTGVTVLGSSGNAVVEGSASFDLLVTGTCPTLGGYSALDPALGLTTLRLGSDLGVDPTTTDLDLGPHAAMITGPGTWQILVTGVSSVPPGLVMPFATSSGGVSNCGTKHVQVIPSPGLNPARLPHEPYGILQSPGSPEPANFVTYLAAAPPVVWGIAPNSCARADGGQLVAVIGAGILTNDAALPSNASNLGPRLELVDPAGLIPDAALGFSSLDNGGTLAVALTPDITPWITSLNLALPYRMDLRVTNPDGQSSDTTLFFDDFYAYPSLADPSAPNPFDTTSPPTPLNTTQLGPGGIAEPIVYSFNDDVVLGASIILLAQGKSPLIIRSRGNIIVGGTIDLSGDTITAPPFAHPAGAGRGAVALQPGGLASIFPFTGDPGVNPIDALTGIPYIKPALGGFHAEQGSGGGGGGMLANVGNQGGDGIAAGMVLIAGGAGGLGLDLNLPLLPIPPLTSETDTPFFHPPGGGGGAAGGLGLEPPVNSGTSENAVGFNGPGGNGGGGIALIADGLIIVNGTLRADGQVGAAGAAAQVGSFAGGGAGGGGGGAILLQSIQGIVIASGATLSAVGAPGGSGGIPGIGDGGAGSAGMIRYALPLDTTWPTVSLVIEAGSLPAADATPYIAP